VNVPRGGGGGADMGGVGGVYVSIRCRPTILSNAYTKLSACICKRRGIT